MEDIGENWLKIFTRFNKQSGKSIEEIIQEIDGQRNLFKNQLDVYPPCEKIFNCFKKTDYQDIKVVIIGQDPYHGKDQATGLAFGITPGNKLPPSLKNIEKELLQDLNIELQDITLEKWAEQGVLLINTSLSVLQSKPGSHIKYWQEFTQYIIDSINSLDCVIFVAWGAHAYNRLKNIDINRHHLIVSSHPSPLSCNKKFAEFTMFNGSKPFSRVNNILKSYSKTIIKW